MSYVGNPFTSSVVKLFSYFTISCLFLGPLFLNVSWSFISIFKNLAQFFQSSYTDKFKGCSEVKKLT